MSINHPIPEKTPPHGGDVYHLARTLGLDLSELLDFSANINPLGCRRDSPGPSSRPWGKWSITRIAAAWSLSGNWRPIIGLSPEQILVGNGSTELIYLAARALKPRRALIVAPAFSEYEHALAAAQVPVDFQMTAEAHNFTLSAPLDPQGRGPGLPGQPGQPQRRPAGAGAVAGDRGPAWRPPGSICCWMRPSWISWKRPPSRRTWPGFPDC